MEKGVLCPSGSEITTEDECRSALSYASSIGITLQLRKDLKTSSWSHVPYQCSYQAGGDQAFHFNHQETSNVDNFLDGYYKMICKKGS